MSSTEQQRTIAPELAPVLDIAAGAFAGEPECTLHRLFLFDPLRREDETWGFVIVTRRAGGPDRLELAAFSYRVDSAGAVTRRLESRRAMIPAERLTDVVEGIVLRLDEPDCSYRELDLGGHESLAAQLEHLRSKLFGGENEPAPEQGEPDLQHGPGDRAAGTAGAD
ncbi:hypothetical protein LLH00_09790 [bacterium]|nr:hypothetical protein [bacterium]